MVDFIKIYWKDKSDFEPFVCDKKNFSDLYSTLEQHSGEIQYPYKSNIGNMNVVVCEHSGYVKGSIHKLHNKVKDMGAHNYNDFTYFQLCHIIDYLTSKLVDVESAGITQLEFGFNINTAIPAETIIKRNVLMHQYRGYNHNKEYHGQGKLKQFDHNNYVIKVYDKAKQYRLINNILRFEIKLLRRTELDRLGINKLDDLKSKSNLRQLFLLMLRRYDELTLVDDITRENEIPLEEKTMLEKYMNPIFWEVDLQGVHSEKRARYRKKFIGLLEKHRLLETKKSLRRALCSKFIYLINH